MSNVGSEEMRRVIEHAADQLEGALERGRNATYPDNQSLIAMAYSLGILRLLASYLVVTDQPAQDGDSRG